MALVTVLWKYARAWPKYAVPIEEADAAIKVGHLGDALVHEWEWDTHFVPHVVTDASLPLMGGVRRRIGSAALDHPGMVVEMTHAIFEADDSEAHRTGTPASDPWRADFAERATALERAHPGQYGYMTRGGGRIIYELETPFILRTRDDAQRWRRLYAVALAYFARLFGVVFDKSCADFTRLFRLPYVTRDGQMQRWPAWGDPHRIGTLTLHAEPCDVEAAAHLLPTAFRAPQLARKFRPTSGTGRGLLYYLLRARDLITAELDDGSCAITCPNAAEHSSETDGTRYYPPGAGEEVGTIHCYHSHCAGRTVGQWLSFFTDEELEAARAAAGIYRIDLASILTAAATRRKS